MLKKLLVIVVFVLAQNLSAHIVEGTINSKILNQKVKYSVYLPREYGQTTKKYPVVYLLHGSGNDDKIWIDPRYWDIDNFINKAVEKKELPPFICIIPYAHKTKYYYINSADGQRNWEDMFYKEFIPQLESKFRISKKRENRGVFGVSMGGYGSLYHSITRPDMFSTCVAFAPGIRVDQEVKALNSKDYEERYGFPFGHNLVGESRITKYYKQKDILRMIDKMSKDDLSRVNYYINCGDIDPFTVGSSLLHVKLTEKGVPHTFNMGTGGHKWATWKNYELTAFKFMTDHINTK